MLGIRQLRRQSTQQRRAWRAWIDSGRLRDVRQVLLLCYGNINRSAVAQRLLQARVTEQDIEVRSAGFHAEQGRPADPVMLRIAAESGIDLSDSRSRCVDTVMVDQAELILVMEHAHRERLLATFPQVADRTLLLGMLPGVEGPDQIDDPYGNTPQVYRRCFERLQDSTDLLAEALTK